MEREARIHRQISDISISMFSIETDGISRNLLRPKRKIEFDPVVKIVTNPDTRSLCPKVRMLISREFVDLILGVVMENGVEATSRHFGGIREGALHQMLQIR